jgi:hypothetical protein
VLGDVPTKIGILGFATSLFCQAVSRQAKQHGITETLQGYLFDNQVVAK